MALDTYIARIQRIDQLIRLKATGSPQELATKLDLSIRALYQFLDELRSMGFPIAYNRHLNSYCYTREGRFFFGFLEEQEPELLERKWNFFSGKNRKA